MEAGTPVTAEVKSPGQGGMVLKNTLILMLAQVAGTPLAIFSAAMMGRFLGPQALGYNYLCTTLAQFGFLFVDWGSTGVVPAAIAQRHAAAGRLIGTSLLWKALAGPAVTLILTLGSLLLGKDQEFLNVYWLVSLHILIGFWTATLSDALRGFERMDVMAYAQVGGQFLSAVLVVSTLFLGGNLYAALVAQAVTNAIVLVWIWRSTRRLFEGPVGFSFEEVRSLLKYGTPFLIVALTNTMQTNIDAAFMSELAPTDVVGWHAAARRLIGVLVMPAVALIASLYPTLSRLFVEDRAEYADTVAKATKGTALLAMPVALCCGVYREVGVNLYGKQGFGRTEQNLLIMSGLVFLVYFSMPLGSAVLAAGKQRSWALVQGICVLVSLILDPLLIPWFQEHYQNGGIGISVAGIISEIPVVLGGVLLLPKGTLGLPVAKTLCRVFIAGAVFIGVAYLLRHISPYLASPVALASYVGTLWFIGSEEREQIRFARDKSLGKLLARFQKK